MVAIFLLWLFFFPYYFQHALHLNLIYPSLQVYNRWSIWVCLASLNRKDYEKEWMGFSLAPTDRMWYCTMNGIVHCVQKEQIHIYINFLLPLLSFSRLTPHDKVWKKLNHKRGQGAMKVFGRMRKWINMISWRLWFDFFSSQNFLDTWSLPHLQILFHAVVKNPPTDMFHLNMAIISHYYTFILLYSRCHGIQIQFGDTVGTIMYPRILPDTCWMSIRLNMIIHHSYVTKSPTWPAFPPLLHTPST